MGKPPLFGQPVEQRMQRARLRGLRSVELLVRAGEPGRRTAIDLPARAMRFVDHHRMKPGLDQCCGRPYAGGTGAHDHDPRR